MEKKEKESKFNRSAYKDKVTSEELKAQDKKVEDVIKTGKNDFAGFLKIENGLNKFLIFPSHENIQQMLPGGENVQNEPFVRSRQIYWLPKEVEDKDDKGEVKKDKRSGKPIMKIVNAPVYDARIHSACGRDIVDVYISMLQKRFEEEFGVDAKDKIKEAMLPVYGQYSKNPSLRVNGIVAKPSWVLYAEKIVGDTRTFGRLEIGKAVKIRINELIAMEEADAVIGSESNNPFTDIELRRALTIKYNPDANDAKLYYTTEIDSDVDKDPKSSTYKQIKFYPFSDDELEKFLSFPSLTQQYVNCYTKKDAELALKGLEIFDEKNEFGIFADDEFLDTVEELMALYPDAPTAAVEEATVPAEEDENVDKFEAMSRNELKAFNRQNKCGVVVVNNVTDDQIREKLREWEIKNEDGEESNEEETETEVEKPKTKSVNEKLPVVTNIEDTAQEDEESDIDKVFNSTPKTVKPNDKANVVSKKEKEGAKKKETPEERIARIRGTNK